MKHDVAGVPVEERIPYLAARPWHPTVWVRTIRRPLSPDESARLSAFAESQMGKPYSSLVRVVALAVPCLPGREFRLDQDNWFCSELVSGALMCAGMWPSDRNPSRVVPADLFFDSCIDLSATWEPPARWTAEPGPPDVGPLFFPRRRWLDGN